jgi:cytochrome c oxidase subunit 2
VWNFDYTPIAHRGVKTPELYLPINKEVVFDVTSKDVVHGFWIPSMGIKINANPGATTTVSVTPNRLGTYRIRCTEICGLNHAYMVTRVHVLTQKAFDHWLATQPTRI